MKTGKKLWLRAREVAGRARNRVEVKDALGTRRDDAAATDMTHESQPALSSNK